MVHQHTSAQRVHQHTSAQRVHQHTTAQITVIDLALDKLSKKIQQIYHHFKFTEKQKPNKPIN